MADGKPFDCYQPTVPENPRGLCCVIANFCSTSGSSSQSPKQIYTKDGDIKRIKDFFEGILSYEYQEYINNTKDAFIDALNKIKNHLSLDCNRSIDRLFLFVLSHGSEMGIATCTDDGRDYDKKDGKFQFVPVEMIASFFDHSNIPSLKDHPKCIFIQACRGTELTKIAVHPVTEQYHTMFDSKEKDGPSTQLEGANNNTSYEEEGEEHEEEQSGESELPWSGSRDKLRPSSENILVCYSCLKGEGAYSTFKQAHFIYKLISVFESYYRTQHLLDMVVEVTRVFGSSIVPEYPYPLIFPHDSPYQAELSRSPGQRDEKFSVYASSNSKCVKGKVVKFNSMRGIITNKAMKIENRSDELYCTLRYKPNNTQIPMKLDIETLEKEFLSNDNFQIDEDKDSLLFHGQWTTGMGKVKVQNKKIVSIEKEVHRCPRDVKYHIMLSNGEDYKVENFQDKDCTIWKLAPNKVDRHLVAVGNGCIKNGVPHLNIQLYQLPIFESTLTRKFFLSAIPVSNALFISDFK